MALKAYIHTTPASIYPFNDPAAAAWIGGRPLLDLQEEECRLAGLAPVHVAGPASLPRTGPFLLLPDYLYASAQCLGRFLAQYQGSGCNASLCIPSSPLTEFLRPLSGARELADTGAGDSIAYDLFYVGGALPEGARDWGSLRAALEATCKHAPLRLPCSTERVRHANVGPGPFWTEVPRTAALAAHVRSWVHILWLNRLLLPLLVRRRLGQKVPAREALRRAAVAANVPGVIVDSVAGGSLDIHPTARLENSIVGSGVHIGARALVWDSILGDDVEVGDKTRFINCVVGDRCNALSDSYFADCTFYPDSTLSNLNMRHCVIGRNVFLTTAVICFTDSLHGPISVLHDGTMQPTGRWILGSCMGHEGMLGTRAIFMPGMALPNGCIIVMRPEEGVHKMPASADPAVPLVWDSSRLRPAGEVFPGYVPAEGGARADKRGPEP